MEEIEKILDQIRVGAPTASHIEALREYLGAGSSRPKLYEAMNAYLRFAQAPDWSVIMPFVRWKPDPMISYMIVAEGSLRPGAPPAFWAAVEQIALGEEWDTEDDVRVQAILALWRSPESCSRRIREVLIRCVADPSPIVRDTAVVTAQRCVGVSEKDVLWGRGEGALLDRVPTVVTDWLSGG